MLNKQTGDMKIETSKKDQLIKQIKTELDKKEKQLSAMTNLNRTLQTQIQSFKSKTNGEESKENKENSIENKLLCNENEGEIKKES
jgi:hypothetical protein